MDSKSLIKLTNTSPLSEWRERINDLLDIKLNEDISYVPINHASTNQTYGVGNKDYYGHLLLSDKINSVSDVTGGVAATPKAVKTAYDLAKNAIPKSSTSIGSTTSPVTFTGTFKGNADTATSATQATNDSDGKKISTTYVKNTDLNSKITSYLSANVFVKDGTSVQWKDILTDTGKINSFIYQNGCKGYMPVLNLDTNEGRIGFGTYYNTKSGGLCRWDYFLNTNETNNPDSFIDLKSNEVVISTPLITATNSNLKTNTITNSSDISTNNINITNNLKIGGTIFSSESEADTGSLGLCSGTAWNTSPSISLFGKGYSDTTLAGAFQLRAIGKTNSYKLTCKSSDGSMVWEGTSFSVSGTNSNITAKTFTGALKGNADTATKATNATNATNDSDGKKISTTYGTSLAVSNGQLYLKNKAGNNLNSVTLPASDCVSYVVESYHNSTTRSWYRKYSDGWIEQGGVHTTTAWQDSVVFDKQFTTPPHVTFTAVYSSFSKNDDGGTHLNGNPTVSGFKYGSNGDARSQEIYWRACGY